MPDGLIFVTLRDFQFAVDVAGWVYRDCLWPPARRAEGGRDSTGGDFRDRV